MVQRALSRERSEQKKYQMDFSYFCRARLLNPGSDLIHLSSMTVDDSIVAVIISMNSGSVCVSGGRDRAGRAVVELYGDHVGWNSTVTSRELFMMLLYFHSITR